MNETLTIVNEFSGIVANCNNAIGSTLGKTINFQYGSSSQILQQLVNVNSSTLGSLKYPLIGLFQPFKEVRGSVFYCQIKFPKIIIAVGSNANDSVAQRYTKSFTPLLYPIYAEFLKQISRWPTVVLENPDYIPHTKLDVPGSAPPSSDDKKSILRFNDYVDAIHIYDLQLTFQINPNSLRN